MQLIVSDLAVHNFVPSGYCRMQNYFNAESDSEYWQREDTNDFLTEALFFILCQPIELCWTRYMCNVGDRSIEDERVSSTRAAFRKIYSHEGLRGLCRGFNAKLASFTVYTSTYYSLLQAANRYGDRDWWRRDKNNVLALTLSLACLSTFMAYPFETIRVRLQVDAGRSI